MPRAFDRRTPPRDHDPLANLLDFGNIDQTVELAGSLIKGYIDGLLDGIVQIVKDLTGLDLQALADVLQGLDLSSVEAFLASLVAGIAALPEVLADLLGQLVALLTTDAAKLAELLQSLVALLITLPELIVSLGQALIDGAKLLGAGSPLDALRLFNLVPVDLLGHIPVANIGTYATNLITDPDFLDAAALATVEGWIHDLTGGFGGTGSMSTVADGTSNELLGNLIAVSPGQIVPLSVKVRWTGLVGTGNPIALAVTAYTDIGAAAQQVIVSHSTIPPITDWIDFSGTYTVPANVVSIRTRLVCGPGATAGTVYFCKVRATKMGELLQTLVRGTDPGKLLPDDIGNLFTGIMTNAAELLNKAGLGQFNEFVSTVAGDFGDDVAAAEARLNDFLHSLSPLNASNINTGAIPDAHVPGLGDIHDAVVTAVGNLTGAGFSIPKMLEVLAGQTHSVIDAGAGITGLFARLSNLESKVSALPVAGGGTGSGTAAGGAVGVIDTDNFERVSSSGLGSLWLQSYSGGAGTWATPNGHDAEFATSGAADRAFLCIRNNPAILRSETDYQRVTLELSSKATRYYDPLFGAYNFCGFDDIWLRISDATTSLANITGIRIRWGGDGGLTIYRFVNGAGTLLAGLGVGGITPPGPGANLIGEAGVLADGAARYFRAKVGANIRLGVAEVGVASGLGAAHRRWGHGGLAEGHLVPLPGQQRPGGAHFWNGMDQTM